jgi:hypothetical protein
VIVSKEKKKVITDINSFIKGDTVEETSSGFDYFI